MRRAKRRIIRQQKLITVFDDILTDNKNQGMGHQIPPQATLTDREIAAVLTYVRKSFGNKASLVHVAEVQGTRALNKNATPTPKS